MSVFLPSFFETSCFLLQEVSHNAESFLPPDGAADNLSLGLSWAWSRVTPCVGRLSFAQVLHRGFFLRS